MHLHSHLPSVPLRPPPPVPPLFPYTTLFRSPGERPEHLRAALRIVGTHGSMLVDLLRPQLEVRTRSEEHTSELQSRGHLVCRLLLEKKKIVIQCTDNHHMCISYRESHIQLSN